MSVSPPTPNTPTRTPTLIDSHCHLDDPVFDPDRAEVIERAVSRGVMAQVLPAVSARHWSRLSQVTMSHANLFGAYGLHPMFLQEHVVDDLDSLATLLAQSPDAVGIGECGLDYYIDEPDKPAQMMYFEAQLTLARQLSLPVIIHARRAVEDVINTIRSSGHTNGMVHSFNGSMEQASRLIDLGFVMSFGGATTYDRAKKLRRLITSLPLDAILLETDSPYQPLANHQGERNEPALLGDVFATICSLRTEAPEIIAAMTTGNVIELFNLPQNDISLPGDV